MPPCPACGQENLDGFRFCSACGQALAADAAPTRQVRKTVTVVFCDVTGSTALGERLDPETLRRAMGRWFESARTAVERHGGTVEKFVGDAVMAVFGIPTIHEDDALRAVRATVEMQERLAELNDELDRDYGVRIEVRTGVNTGEVVAGEGETLVTGDAVNVAARLEQAAQPGETLIGASTHRLVRDAVRSEPVEPLTAKGKADPVDVYRLLEVIAGAKPFARRLDAPIVGRESELAHIGQAYERVVRERTAYLFTLLGAAGIGKSRMVAAFLDDIGDSATVVEGRCLAYGEGITFWPLLEIVRRLHGEDSVSTIAERLRDDENAELIAVRVSSAVGLAESAGPSDETFWAVRKLFEWHARQHPLVVLFDDIQWGEPTFLDLVEHVADLSRDAPILLICVARPELLDERPGWGGGKFNATSVLLEPLDGDQSAELMRNLLGRAKLDEGVRAQVIEAAEGNPLFVEEMLAMLIDDGLLERHNGDWVATADLGDITVPPTIEALLAARLDRLSPPERAVAERASIEGKVFHGGAVAELSPAEARSEVAAHLQALIRRELVRPDHSDFPGEDAFRFRHLLIRDAAYRSMPKELRAELHERFAAWLAHAAGDRVIEHEEIVGYHLEQAFRHRVELSPPDAATRSLGGRAAERLGSAGMRALARGDTPAAVSLLDRAVGVLAHDDPLRTQLLCDLGFALTDHGELERAGAVLADATVAAEAGDNPALRAVVAMRSAWVRLLGGGAHEEMRAKVEESARILDEVGDEAGLAESYLRLGMLRTWRGQCVEAQVLFERAVALAQRVGNMRIASESLARLLTAAYWGPMPLSEALLLCRKVVEESQGSRDVQGLARIVSGNLQWATGRSNEGRSEIAAGRAILEELGQHLILASSRQLALAAILAGNAQEAERELRQGYEELEAMGEKGYLSTTAAILALALSAQGNYEEAETYSAAAREFGAEDDLSTQLHWRCALAEVLASRGDFEHAERLIQEALVLGDPTDLLQDRAAVLMSQATVMRMAGDRANARPVLEQAIKLLEAKGNAAGRAWVERLAADL
jgi:class 3 adenylate cyclase/tetratricopeptide (TPR) repeat protein